ncbi:MAG: hypothetical protein RBT11_14080 [Desulfobacterales bacterium]|nr:hypothetical protein [Desulfobacterales bacterium]
MQYETPICDTPLSALHEFFGLCRKYNMAFMVITRNSKGLWHITDNEDILVVGLLDATNPVSKRMRPQICSDQFREELKREIQKYPLGMKLFDDSQSAEDDQPSSQVPVGLENLESAALLKPFK